MATNSSKHTKQNQWTSDANPIKDIDDEETKVQIPSMMTGGNNLEDIH